MSIPNFNNEKIYNYVAFTMVTVAAYKWYK